VLQGMTSGGGGQGGRNPFLYTALNLNPGATTPIAPPAAAPAAPAVPAAQATPLDQTPLPPPRPPGFGYGVNQGVVEANPPTPPPRPPLDLSGTRSPTPVGTSVPNTGTFNNPSIPPTPMSSMPNPVFASAQNLLKLLFPTG
jgi:hypothetical protein